MTECKFCETNSIYGVQNEECLIDMLLDQIKENGWDGASIVADENTARELLYLAVNDDSFDITMVSLDRYDEDNAYIISIESYVGDNDDYEFSIHHAMGLHGKYIATNMPTFIQFDLDCKCEYVEDMLNDKYVKEFNPQFFIIGEFNDEDEDDEPNENHDENSFGDFINSLIRLYESFYII